jgi:hypothetical protein
VHGSTLSVSDEGYSRSHVLYYYYWVYVSAGCFDNIYIIWELLISINQVSAETLTTGWMMMPLGTNRWSTSRDIDPVVVIQNYFEKTTFRSVFFVVLDEFLLTTFQVWEKNSDLKNLTKS